jgi:hypothetical protein
MTNHNRKASPGHKPSGMDPGGETEKEAGEQPGNETSPTERIELAHPEPDQNVANAAADKPLLPHERDQTTGGQGTSQGNEDKRSRAVIGQAAEDTKRGLKDTDRRGIPSDIMGSDIGGADADSDKKR